MKVLLLSPYPERLDSTWTDEEILSVHGPNQPDPVEYEWADWVVSYGHRYVIKPEIVRIMGNRIINIHIGYLPWGRGADPNFWSWHDDTPKGVTIHQMDEGIDTGPLLVRMESSPDKRGTLKTTYEQLHREAIFLFGQYWHRIRDGMESFPQTPADATSHKKKDREAIWHHFPLGWDTPVRDVEEFGRRSRDEHGQRSGSSGA